MKVRFCEAFLIFILVTQAVHSENWPCFRGPNHQGISSEKNIPTKWSATENVAWKTAIPGQGWSSPVIWNDQVFLTTTTKAGESCRVMSIDRKTGQTLWDREAHRQKIRKKNERNSFATPTPATDGTAVYSVFSDGTIIAVDFDGRTLWKKKGLDYFSEHGLGGSPLLYRDLLIMAFDGSSDIEAQVGWKIPWDQAVILALDRKTGDIRWRGKRGLSRIAHSTPNILKVNGKDQLVSIAGDVIQGFDLEEGSLIWTAYSQGEGVVPSAVVGNGMVYASSGFEASTIRAIRANGIGDVTKSHIAWEQTASVPRIPSFLYIEPYLYTISENGIAMCLDGSSGEIVWRQRIGGNHSASPVWADGMIYFLSDEGETTIVRSGPEFLEVGRNSIGEHTQASLAISNGQIFIRTKSNLYCVGSTSQ
jgi:outer membrane protein assembly factor BamB